MVGRSVSFVGVGGGDLTDLPRKYVPDRVAGRNQIVALGVRHAHLPDNQGMAMTNDRWRSQGLADRVR